MPQQSANRSCIRSFGLVKGGQTEGRTDTCAREAVIAALDEQYRPLSAGSTVKPACYCFVVDFRFTPGPTQ